MADRIRQTSAFPDARVLADVIEKETRKVAREIAYRIASKLAGRVRATILNQEQDWEPLSEAWLRKKEKMGWDTRILRATGKYVNSIVARRVKDQAKYTVSPSEEKIHSGATLKQLGTWLEFGTKMPDGNVRMPARPHWRPVWREFKMNQEKLIREIQKQILPAYRNALKTRRVNKTVFYR